MERLQKMFTINENAMCVCMLNLVRFGGRCASTDRTRMKGNASTRNKNSRFIVAWHCNAPWKGASLLSSRRLVSPFASAESLVLRPSHRYLVKRAPIHDLCFTRNLPTVNNHFIFKQFLPEIGWWFHTDLAFCTCSLNCATPSLS